MSPSTTILLEFRASTYSDKLRNQCSQTTLYCVVLRAPTSPASITATLRDCSHGRGPSRDQNHSSTTAAMLRARSFTYVGASALAELILEDEFVVREPRFRGGRGPGYASWGCSSSGCGQTTGHDGDEEMRLYEAMSGRLMVRIFLDRGGAAAGQMAGHGGWNSSDITLCCTHGKHAW